MALAALSALAPAPLAFAGSYLQPDPTPPDSTSGALVVETAPPGLIILVDEVQAGRSPLGPIWLPPKLVRVRALPDDPLRFDTASDESQVTIRPGETARVFLDLRPTLVLRSAPEPAKVFRVGPEGKDSLLGETPLPMRPAQLEGGRLRFRSPNHADALLLGDSLIGAAASGPVLVSLRQIGRSLPLQPPKPPLYRKKWFQWGLIGLGAGLTGTAAFLRREGDHWYDRYLESSDRDVLDTYFDRAVKYDRYSLASLAVGQVLFTSGLVLLVGGFSP